MAKNYRKAFLFDFQTKTLYFNINKLFGGSFMELSEKKLLNKKEAANILNISVVTVDRLRKEGKLRYRQIGNCIRFSLNDIEDFIEKSKIGA
jgi:excisionase family DNA binding protein